MAKAMDTAQSRSGVATVTILMVRLLRGLRRRMARSPVRYPIENFCCPICGRRLDDQGLDRSKLPSMLIGGIPSLTEELRIDLCGRHK